MRWLKKVLTGGKKEGDRDRGKDQSAAVASAVVAPIERRRWSFAKARSSVADASRRPSVTAVVAGELYQVRPCGCGQDRHVEAAILIQKAFRGYLVRLTLLCCSWLLVFLHLASSSKQGVSNRVWFSDEHAAYVQIFCYQVTFGILYIIFVYLSIQF
jgi:hypothetical protein